MFSLFKKPEEEIVAVFDIGNGSIGGALVKLEAHGLPVILYTYREPLTFAPHAVSKNLVASMLKMLSSVAQHLAHDGLAHIKTSPFGGHRLRDAYCVFSSPWYISQTKIVREEQEKPFVISESAINDLIKKEQERFNVAMKEGRYEQIFGPDTKLFEKRVVNIKLNGYQIQNPIGKRAQELELTLFTSFISEEILRKAEETLHSAFAVRNIHHFSYGFVSWSASQILFPDIRDYFFIDVSGETTDVSLIIRDILIETISFPMGRSTLIRTIVKNLEVSSDIARSLLAMHFAYKLEPEFQNKVIEALKPLKEDWQDQFTVALQKFQKVYSLPRATLMTADIDTSPFFLRALEKELPTELNLAKGSLSVIFIGADKVQSFVEVLPNVEQDSFLALESVFLNKLFISKR